MHTLPDGFHRIRRFGLFANAHRAEKLAQCRGLLGVTTVNPASAAATVRDNDNVPVADAIRACPCCGGRMITIEIFDASQANVVRTRYPIVFDSS